MSKRPTSLIPVFLLIVLGCGFVFAAVRTAAADELLSALRAPEGFAIERAAGEPLVRFPMFAAFDDQGRLYVAESSGLDLYAELAAQTRKCRVSRLEDRNGDGQFETSTVFADKLVYPMGLAWRDGRLYVADPPDLVVYEDADNDGRGDKRKVILTGFGYKDNGSLHGLIFGPDGWLYMTMGCPDGYKLKRADGSFIEGESGALIRCRPDGSEPEVVCRGFVNLVEAVFTPGGDVFGTDNWFRDVNQPGSQGMRDALVHLLEGGRYPYYQEVGTPQPVTGVELGPMGLYPAVALSGVELYRARQFPAQMRGNLFTAQHNARKVVRHVLAADGATFRLEDHDFVTTDNADFHPSDVLEAADGSLLVVDTGSWYVHHCPTGRIRDSMAPGGIFRVTKQGAEPVGDPSGRAENFRSMSVDRLVALLGDERPVVCDRAQGELVARGRAAVAPVAKFAGESSDLFARQAAVWVLCRIGDEASRSALRGLLDDERLTTTAARALGRCGDRKANAALAKLLAHESPSVRLPAAEALARCGDETSLPAIWTALTENPDEFLEHSLVHAAHHVASERELLGALEDAHPRVQRAALILLAQPPRAAASLSHEMVLAKIAASDPELRQAALDILRERPEWTEPAIGLLRGWLKQADLTEEESEALRGTLLAFQADPGLQTLLAKALSASDEFPAQRQREVWQTLEQTTLVELPADWVEAARRSISDDDGDMQAHAVRTAAAWQTSALDEALAAFAAGGEQPRELRIAALGAIIIRRPRLTADSFALLLTQLQAEEEPLARLRAAEILGQADLSDDQRLALIASARGDAMLAPDALLPALRNTKSEAVAAEVLEYLAESIERDWRPGEKELQKTLASLPPAVQPQAEGIETRRREKAAGQRELLTDHLPLLSGGDPVKGAVVFHGRQTACAACHRVGDRGGSVGPDLTRIGAIRSPNDLLESIVLPSSTFAQGFENYAVFTHTGRVFSGLIARQDDRLVVLRDASGAETRIGRGDVESLERQQKSLMPEGLPRTMTKEQFRDLLAYLQSLK